MFSSQELIMYGSFALPLFLVNVLVRPFAVLLGGNSHRNDFLNLLKSTDMRRKVAIITGANTGVGERTAASLSKLGAHVIIACRDKARGNEAELKLREELKLCDRKIFPLSEYGTVQFTQLDLSSLVSVVHFVQKVKSSFTHVDVLVNNAGLNQKGRTSVGLQQLFQVNYLGHYLLFKMLRPLLSATHSDGSDAGRVVNLSSVMHHVGQSDFRRSSYGHLGCYDDSKLYMNYLTLEINDRYGVSSNQAQRGKKGKFCQYRINAISANPGAVQSDIWRHVPPLFKIPFNIVMRLLFLNVEQGCATSVMGAILPLGKLEEYYHHHSSILTRLGRLSYHPSIPYLVPYKILFGNFALSHESIGPYAGPNFSASSNVENIEEVARDLWEYSSALCIQKLKEELGDDREGLEGFEELMHD